MGAPRAEFTLPDSRVPSAWRSETPRPEGRGVPHLLSVHTPWAFFSSVTVLMGTQNVGTRAWRGDPSRVSEPGCTGSVEGIQRRFATHHRRSAVPLRRTRLLLLLFIPGEGWRQGAEGRAKDTLVIAEPRPAAVTLINGPRPHPSQWQPRWHGTTCVRDEGSYVSLSGRRRLLCLFLHACAFA